MKLRATYLYNGSPEYWDGNSDRWEGNKGCLFAHYGARTTVADLVAEWVSDFCMGGSFPEDVTKDDVREALMEMLGPIGRKDYESGAIWNGSIAYAEVNHGSMESPVCIVLIECEEKDGYDYDRIYLVQYHGRRDLRPG